MLKGRLQLARNLAQVCHEKFDSFESTFQPALFVYLTKMTTLQKLSLIRLATSPVSSCHQPDIATHSDILQQKYPFFVDDDAITLDRALAFFNICHTCPLSGDKSQFC